MTSRLSHQLLPVALGVLIATGLAHAVTPAGDPLACYQSRTTRGATAFPPREVSLVDRYGTTTPEVREPRALCAPADIVSGAPSQPAAYLTCHQTKEPRALTPATSDVTVRDAFGDLTLAVLKPLRLCVPSVVGGTAPGTPRDHYRCYKTRVKGGTAPFAPRTITLTDAFETRMYEVVKPVEYCTPADKNGEGVLQPMTSLTCYRLDDASSDPPFARTDVTADSQFGSLALTVRPLATLCLPSALVPPTTSTTTTSTASTSTTSTFVSTPTTTCPSIPPGCNANFPIPVGCPCSLNCSNCVGSVCNTVAGVCQ